MRLTTRRSTLRCALCHEALDTVERTCGGCGTVLHAECTSDLGRCPTLGCHGTPRRRRPWGWIALAIVFNAVIAPLSALVLFTGAWVNYQVAPKPFLPFAVPGLATPAVPAAPAPPPPRLARPLAGGVSPADLRRDCLKLIGERSALPLENTFERDECAALPETVARLAPERVTVEGHVVAIELAERSIYVFDDTMREPPGVGERWAQIADAVWERD